MNQIDKLKNLLDQRGVKINWHHYPTPEQVYAQIPEEVLGGVSYDTFKDHFFSDLDKMAEGGTMPEGKDGDVKRSWRKGKKMAVYMGGQWHHFGDSSMDDFRTHKSEKRKEAFYDRHRSALQGDDPRSKAFRVYAKKTWQEGGDMNEVSVPLPNGQEYVFSQDIIEPETGMPFSEVAQRLLMALQNGEIQEAEYAQMIMQLVEANEMAKQQDAAGQMGQQGMMQQPMEQPMGQPMMQQPISGEASMRRGGYLKDKDTYVTKDGRETERGLWANVYLKKKREGMAEGGEMGVELPPDANKMLTYELWEAYTGKPWSEAKKMGLTTGSYEDNLKLRDRILNGDLGANLPPDANKMLTYELWEAYTGKPWSEAEKMGLTTGSYEDNLKLRESILNGELGFNSKASSPRVSVPTQASNNRDVKANAQATDRNFRTVQASDDIDLSVNPEFDLPQISVTAQAPNWLKYKREFMSQNPFNLSQYVEERVNQPQTGRAAYQRIDENEFRKSVAEQGKRQYENQMYNYIQNKLVESNPQQGLPRGKWLDTFSEKEQKILTRNPRYQPTYITDFKRSLQTMFEKDPTQTFYNILNSNDFSTKEKEDLIMQHIENPIVSKLAEAAGIFAPLSMGSKMIQSTYRDDTTFLSALQGIKNNASIVEDIITDITTFVGPGTAAKFKNLLRADKIDDAAKVLSQVSRNLPEETLSVVDDFAKEAGGFAASGAKAVDNIIDKLINQSTEMSSSEISDLAKTLKDYLDSKGISDPMTAKIGQLASKSSEMKPSEVSDLAQTLKDYLDSKGISGQSPKGSGVTTQSTGKTPNAKADAPVKKAAKEVNDAPLIDAKTVNKILTDIQKAIPGITSESQIKITGVSDPNNLIKRFGLGIELNDIVNGLVDNVFNEISKLTDFDELTDVEVVRLLDNIEAISTTLSSLKKAKPIDPKMADEMNKVLGGVDNILKTLDKVYDAANPSTIKKGLRFGGYKKMGRNFGGALDPNMVDGGNLVPVSEDATMVQADNPQATDSVETPNAFLDDQEVVVDMPDGRKYVFSQDLKEPETGRSFAELAMELIQMRDAGNIPMEQFNTYIVSLADANDQMREGTPQMAEGGEVPNDMLPYQVWEKYTGTPWSEAKKKGLTDGTEQSNLALKKKILSGEFGQSVQAELPEVTVRAEMPSHIRYKRDFMRENPYDVQGYISKAMSGRKTGRAAYAAIDEKQFLQDLENQYKSNYSKQLSDYVRGRIELETPRGKKDRGEWLDSLTEKERQVIMASDKNQPTYWMEFARGITSLVENNPAQAVMTIMNNKNYSKDEKKAMVMRYMENPAFAKAADAAGVLAPLNIPAKMVQSLYRDDYSLEQALSGVKNDASMLEDIIGDLIFTVGYGAAKSALNLAQRGSVKEAAKVLKEAARQNKGFDAIEEVATQPPLTGSPSRPKGKRANAIGINDPLFDEVMGGMGLPNIGQDIIDDPLRGAAIGDGGLPKIGAEDVRFAPQGSKAIKDVDPENPVVIFKNFLLQREGDKYYKALDNPETVSRMQALDAEYGMNLTDLYEAAKRRWDSGRSLHGNERLKIKNLEEGVEGQSQGPSVRSVIIKKDPQERASEVVRLSDLSKNYINNQVQYSDYPKVVWHELSHDLNKYALETNAAFKADVANVFHKNVRDIDPQALAKAFEGAPKSEIPFYASQDLQYIKQPTEAWAFLSTNLRQELVEKGIFKDYLDTLTPEKLQQVIDSGAEVVNRFSPFIKDKAKFIELFNKMTLATAPIVMDYIYNYEPK